MGIDAMRLFLRSCLKHSKRIAVLLVHFDKPVGQSILPTGHESVGVCFFVAAGTTDGCF
jgi:hypothetical protein